jgi:DNA repair photolyase
LEHLDWLEKPVISGKQKKKIHCYIQYTLNDYEKEGLEKVPSLDNRIETFKLLVDKLGKGHVIWRFDPMILTDQITIDDLLCKVENIGNQLKGYTEKLVFSFADIVSYKKVKSNLERNGINYSEWTDTQMILLAEKLQQLNKKWGYKLATCGEKIDIAKYGIEHNHCVDDNLMIRFAYNDKVLMDFLGVEVKNIENSLFGMEPIPADAIILNSKQYAIKKKNNSDKGQRQFCGCMASKDIGEYNTCPHLCEYCYANASKEVAVRNWEQHLQNLKGETIKSK